jgi:(p)ppGpp synthase/HD superfamily hydrolase
MALSQEFEAALVWAHQQHARQQRHNTRTPYIGHLLATCAIVLEEGGDERLAIAALLHDVLEDTPTTRAELRDRFGDDVYAIVDDCTDADLSERDNADWRDRKDTHLDRMGRAGPDSLLVIAADKLSSLQSLLDDLRRYGPALFDHSRRSADELLGNYRAVFEVLRRGLGDRPVVVRLGARIRELSAYVGPKAPT